MVGARPSEGSSSNSRRGRLISARPTASICCCPPLSRPPAWVSRPRLLLLDEPSLGLAPTIVQQLGRIIRSLNEQGTTILLVEQNARMALKLAHRAYVMATGRVVRTGTGSDLLHDMSVRDMYLGEASA